MVLDCPGPTCRDSLCGHTAYAGEIYVVAEQNRSGLRLSQPYYKTVKPVVADRSSGSFAALQTPAAA